MKRELGDKPELAIFNLAEIPDELTLCTLNEINDAIRSVGCSAKYSAEHRVIYLTIDYATVRNSRNAGRRKKRPAGDHRLITCGEVRAMLKEGTANDVARELGVSRATLFRRLKDREDRRYF